MARLESAPTAVRSIASLGGKGSIEAKFGPSLPKIGFPAGRTPEVKALNSLPIRNNIPETRSDSGKPKSSIRILGSIRSGNEIRVNPGQVVNRTIRFQPYPVAVRSSVPMVSEVKQINAVQDIVKNTPNEARNNQIASKPEAKPSTGSIVLPKELRVTRIEQGARGFTVDQLKPALEPVQRAQIDMLVKRARRSLISSRSEQAVAMVTDPETLTLEQLQIASASATAPSESTINKGSAVPLQIEAPVQAPRVRARRRPAGSGVEVQRQQDQRKRYVEWDLEMNALRLRRLIRSYEEIQAENPSAEVNGGAVGERSLIESDELRSPILDQRGYRYRPDGGLRKIRSFLASIRSINKDRLKEGVDAYTALRETKDKPRKWASRREMDIVFKSDEKVVLDKYEPLEVIDEVVTTERKREVVIAGKAGLREQVQPIEEQQKVNIEINEAALEVKNVGILSSPLDTLGHNISAIFIPRFQNHIVAREELVFN